MGPRRQNKISLYKEEKDKTIKTKKTYKKRENEALILNHKTSKPPTILRIMCK